jgi:uncharacterized protein
MRALSPLELRVLGVLVEKQHTVPDSYPLSLNTLTLGCNQKTARDPVMNVSEADVVVAVDSLKGLSLVFEQSGARVSRYEHNAARALALPAASVALLMTLALRGPQTTAELRTNAERLHRFADLSSVESFLDELAGRADDKGGPAALRLPKAPGAREARWVQLLGGPVDAALLASSSAEPAQHHPPTHDPGELAALRAEQAALREELGELRAQLLRLADDLGVKLALS